MPSATALPPAERVSAAPPWSTDGPHQEEDLIRRYRNGDLSARDRLIERFLPLARRLARRYRYTEESQEDLLQVASIGLVKAVDRFEPERGRRFSQFAAPTILGELKRHFRDRGWAVRVPRAVQERVMAVNAAVGSLAAELGHSPTLQEIADQVGLTVEDVLEAREAAAAYETTSLDAPRPGSERDESSTYSDSVGAEDVGYELVELGEQVAPAVRRLPERERVMLYLRFVEDLTQSEIAEQIGVSQMHVSRLLRRALNKLGESVQGSPEAQDKRA